MREQYDKGAMREQWGFLLIDGDFPGFRVVIEG
jgi:hypothetical protein